jgi:hypothetical protein
MLSARDCQARARERIELELRGLAAATGAWALAVMLPDDAGVALECGFSHNLPPDWQRIINPLSSPSLNVAAYQDGHEIVRTDPFDFHGPVSTHRIAALIIVPLLAGGEVVGTLEVIFEQAPSDLTRQLARVYGAAETLAGALVV